MISEANDSFPYELRQYPVQRENGQVPAALIHWNQAVLLGFHEKALTETDIAKFVDSEARDGRAAWGAYAETAPAGALSADFPVATYAANPSTLTVGEGDELPASLITAVTVRPSHRRKGLLRRMITAHLTETKEKGIPLAALTASEATIYGRFGFGVATHARSVEVATGPQFALRTQTHGTVEVADPAVLEDIGPALAQRVHEQLVGSVGRQDAYRFLDSGAWTYDSPEEDKKVRAAIHYNDAGLADGFVSYSFAGWDHEPATMKVRDIVAVDANAYLALWDFLGHLDLVKLITFSPAPEQDPLEWALVNKRSYKVKRTFDLLWIRVLDVPSVLLARPYSSDGQLSFAVTDSLGLADGSYHLSVIDGVPNVGRLPDDAVVDLRMAIADLSSLYLAGIDAATLAAAGRISGSREALATWDAMFTGARLPYCPTEF
ncbi:MAG: GNAT family N-acetyltransferase [Acidobacteria bacterium]|nr:GNAT family N-acetyltransferase [Acidobacteriota bacterium]